MQGQRRGPLTGVTARGHAAHTASSHSKLRGPKDENADKEASKTTCAACGRYIESGQRFIELSVTLPNASASNHAASQQRQARESRGSGTKSSSSRGITVKAHFHLSCLRCTECGKSLPNPAGDATTSSDNPIVLCSESAIEALTGTQTGPTSNDRSLQSESAAVKRASLQRNPAARGALLQYFVAHAKCKERPCAVCHRPISLNEPKVALPIDILGEGEKGDETKHNRQSRSRVEKGSGKSGGVRRFPSGSTTDEATAYQHVACTRCSSCGKGFDPDNNSKHLIIFDQQRHPYHPECLACCCCHRPLIGTYEVHEFFGKPDTCEMLLYGSSELPLPAGLPAAVAGGWPTGSFGVERGQNTKLNYGAAPVKDSGNRVTAKYGGLCCSWCSLRVPRCVCCERRCAVYTNENNEQVLPRVISQTAIAAAKMAADISLGKKLPPTFGQAERAADSVTQRAAGVTAGSTASTDLLGEVKGVVCGQCASLPKVTTEPELRATSSWLQRVFCQAGIAFSHDMIQLQKLIRTINEEEVKKKGRRNKDEDAQRAGSVAASKMPTRKVTPSHMGTAVLQKKIGSSASGVVTWIDDLGVPIELVDFSALNSEVPPSSGRRWMSRTSSNLAASTMKPGMRRNVTAVHGSPARGSSMANRRLPSSTPGSVPGRSINAADIPFARILFGRCHVQVLTMKVAGAVAAQFDEEVKARSRLSAAGLAARNAGRSGVSQVLSGVERRETEVASSASDRSDMKIRRQSTLVGQHVLDVAAAYAAALDGDMQSPGNPAERGKRVQKEQMNDSDRSRPGHDAVVAAGALLRDGSFAGGLLRTKSGIHTQGLSVLLVERICVVGSVPRVMVVQHMGHEWLHAYLACKQKTIKDTAVEEGACNVAATEALLRFGAELHLKIQQENEDNTPVSERTKGSDLSGSQYEMLILRFRIWKMKQSKDPVYGAGYRTCLNVVSSGNLSFADFVRWLLKK
ncbi:conserved hypothetical protein [Neospora caninum Liverpool]|uniref:LIM zinc-binding domain-containing protein n=1 Tax=Neospora caninum (strain Liverpool) TaxID=572307 RepID=F0VHN4_NEOCL|nr:conserved hypothetical protein [Neospora caninum Liverpool]CBZ53245.1 conserved hypothetical protein [Neospora caninum Liverpool]CEL67234.1 TPA: hypothetical protein BN1204_030320 [Neospora caninum Liverpool]|eukprot:XP_003883277.1 conserved hypothetical protein [Neospora caninum Liverpool]